MTQRYESSQRHRLSPRAHGVWGRFPIYPSIRLWPWARIRATEKPSTIPRVTALATLKDWPASRWAFALAVSVVSALIIGLPTDVIANPVFGRQGTPVEPWAPTVLVITALLSGMLAATYFRVGSTAAADGDLDRPTRLGGFGGLLSFFAVGCPICNKLVVIALGTSGAFTWFAPVQPYLGAIAIGLLVWALIVRLRGEVACPVTPAESREAVDATS